MDQSNLETIIGIQKKVLNDFNIQNAFAFGWFIGMHHKNKNDNNNNNNNNNNNKNHAIQPISNII